MKTIQLVKNILEKWGFPVVQEHDTALTIRYQMSYITLGSMNGDSRSLTVSYCGLFKAENEDELILGLKTCNELNMGLMMVKGYIDDENDLIVAAEFFFESEDDLENLLDNALNSVIIGKCKFQSIYQRRVAELEIIEETGSDTEDNA